MSEARDVGALCARYGSMVLRRCRRLLGNEAEALDACQDVFVRLLQPRRQDIRHPSSLLFRTATNVCLNRLRDRGRRPEGHYADPEGEDADRLYRIACAGEPGGQIEARLRLDRLFGRHPASSRTIAVLHYVDGFTLDEVAGLTGLSVSGVRKRLRALRDTLTEMDR